jgi:uncharacterized protein with HEPN domain
MQHDIKMYFEDIITSIDSVFEYLINVADLESYKQNKLVRRAVERELEIIGEAMSQILKIQPEISISDARRIVDLRNLVIHAYNSVDNTIIWGIIHKQLPILKSEIDVLIQN